MCMMRLVQLELSVRRAVARRRAPRPAAPEAMGPTAPLARGTLADSYPGLRRPERRFRR